MKKKHGAHVDQHGLQGIVTVSYKTYRNTYQISRYVSLVEKVYRYTPNWMYNILTNPNRHLLPLIAPHIPANPTMNTNAPKAMNR